jgi:hypothetical protein
MDIIEWLQVRYSSPIAVISLLTWFMAWWGADLLSKSKSPFLAHALFTFSNLLLIGVHAHAGQWELMLMALTFLKTSITGCFHHNPRRVQHPAGEDSA